MRTFSTVEEQPADRGLLAALVTAVHVNVVNACFLLRRLSLRIQHYRVVETLND